MELLSNNDETSSVWGGAINQSSKEEIESLLVEYGRSVNSTVHADSKLEFSKTDSIKILSDGKSVVKTDFDELGRMLLRDLDAKFKAKGDMFLTVVIKNFDLANFRDRIKLKAREKYEAIEQIKKEYGNSEQCPDAGYMEIEMLAETGYIEERNNDQLTEELGKLIADYELKNSNKEEEANLKLISELTDLSLKGLKEEDYNKSKKALEKEKEKDLKSFKKEIDIAMEEEMRGVRAMYGEKMEMEIKSMKYKLAQSFVESKKKFEKWNSKKKDAEWKLKEMELEKKECSILIALAEGFIKLEQDLANEILDAMKPYDTWLRNLDRENINLPDGTSLTGVFEKRSLPGMTNLILKLYRKTSPITFTKLLLKTQSIKLNEKDTIENPELALDQVSNIIARWDSTNSWEKMVDDDFYFSVILVQAYHPGEFQRKLIEKFIEFMEDKEKHKIIGSRCVYNSIYEYISRNVKRG